MITQKQLIKDRTLVQLKLTVETTQRLKAIIDDVVLIQSNVYRKRLRAETKPAKAGHPTPAEAGTS